MEELRRQNLVYRINRRGEVHLPETIPLKIVALPFANAQLVVHGENPAQVKEWFDVKYADLSPIPLTEEWLERFGFAKVVWNSSIREYYRFLRSEYFGIMLRFGEWKDDPDGLHAVKIGSPPHVSGSTFKIDGIEHVHQLQNLYFALTGEELKTVHDNPELLK